MAGYMGNCYFQCRKLRTSRMTGLSFTCMLWSLLVLVTVPAHCELPRVFLPAPEVVEHPVSASVCANQTPFLALILVMSHPDNFSKRRAMREAYTDNEITALGFRRVFVIGAKESYADDVQTTKMPNSLSTNSTKELDLLQVEMVDTYGGLVNKALAAFAWAADHCKHARFVAKSDDDMFIDFYSLATWLTGIGDDAVDAIRGHLNQDSINPTPYMAGGFYVTSPRTFQAIVGAAERTEMFIHVAEDVYFTGVLADKIGAVQVDVGVVRHWEGAPHCCIDEARGVVHECQYAVFEDRRGMATVHTHRFKAHGKFCYFFRCERFKGTLIGRLGLTCFR